MLAHVGLWSYIENVGEHEEQCDEHGHSPRHDFRGDEEASPRHDHKEARRQVVDVQVLQLVPGERDLDPRDGIVADGAEVEDSVLLRQQAYLKRVVEDCVALGR